MPALALSFSPPCWHIVRRWPSTNQEWNPHQDPTRIAPWSQTSILRTEKINFCCVSPTVCGICSWQVHEDIFWMSSGILTFSLQECIMVNINCTFMMSGLELGLILKCQWQRDPKCYLLERVLLREQNDSQMTEEPFMLPQGLRVSHLALLGHAFIVIRITSLLCKSCGKITLYP